jgi:hypothetical protein
MTQPSPPNLADLKQRTLAEVARRSAPTRSQARTRALIAYTAATTAMAVVFFAAGGIDHSRGRPIVTTVLMAAGACAIALVATTAALGRGASMLGRSMRVLALVAALVPVGTFVWLVAWHNTYADPFSRIGYRCLGLTLVMGIAPLIVTAILRAGSAVRAPKASGAAIGAVCGAWGGVGVDLWCPLSDPKHVAVGHVLPILILVGVGAIVGHVVLRMRARS